ncbi:hypothetical protein OH76DRAFT_1406448 [Lentinus brumalis]|uniref:WD40 repeat-like protein n=1 Tax=Lentinus brumalis TaxID=2498619 RepID=A0A371D2R6_9APHY|nr:hypothetical protein OH76DRAFT_1406448 [Polyporus brumalis]
MSTDSWQVGAKVRFPPQCRGTGKGTPWTWDAVCLCGHMQPARKDIFASCSNDSTVRLWELK